LVHELWSHRELVIFLAWRDVKVRYKQAALGIGWAILRPLLMMTIFTLLFGRIAHVDTGGIPYPVYAFVGLVAWTYFSTAVMAGSDSLVNNSNLVSKVYFPRLALPLASLVAQLPDLCVGALILAVLMAVEHVHVGWQLAAMPVVLLLLALAAASVTTWLSALNVNYRDVKYAVPFLIQVWLFVTPVLYPSTAVPSSLRLAYELNPAAAPIELARWSAFRAAPLSGTGLVVSIASALVLLATGVHYFRHAENTFADVI
jgi:lipopolysaccharide transport system permease protein